MTAFPHTETATFRGGYEAPYNLLYLLEKLKKRKSTRGKEVWYFSILEPLNKLRFRAATCRPSWWLKLFFPAI